jgi:hypothetical protein
MGTSRRSERIGRFISSVRRSERRSCVLSLNESLLLVLCQSERVKATMLRSKVQCGKLTHHALYGSLSSARGNVRKRDIRHPSKEVDERSDAGMADRSGRSYYVISPSLWR